VNRNYGETAMSALLVGIIWTPVSFLIGGLMIAWVWGATVVPIFGLPHLSLPEAIGVALVATLLTHKPSGQDDREPLAVVVAGIAEQLVRWGIVALAALVVAPMISP
jgi:hypothetical protein